MPINVRWGQIDLIHKTAIANKELYEVAAQLIR
jgi:ATP-dependent RNA helicase TDRD9